MSLHPFAAHGRLRCRIVAAAQLFRRVRADGGRFRDAASLRANAMLLAGAQPGTTSFYATSRALRGTPGPSPRIKRFDTLGAR